MIMKNKHGLDASNPLLICQAAPVPAFAWGLSERFTSKFCLFSGLPADSGAAGFALLPDT